MNCSTRPSKSIQGFYCPSVRFDTTPCIHFLHFRPNAPPTYSNFRLKNSVTLKLGRKLLPTCASKANPAEGSDGKKGKAAQGPPFLTILAGFLVFLVLCWIIGSILLWLIGLFVRAPPSKWCHICNFCRQLCSIARFTFLDRRIRIQYFLFHFHAWN